MKENNTNIDEVIAKSIATFHRTSKIYTQPDLHKISVQSGSSGTQENFEVGDLLKRENSDREFFKLINKKISKKEKTIQRMLSTIINRNIIKRN